MDSITKTNRYSEPKCSLWNEFDASWEKMKYNAWGATTQSISKFHLENIIDSAKNCQISDYQYAEWSGIQHLKSSICENFSKIYFKNISHDEILICPGAIKCGDTIINTFVKKDSKDELLIFDPYYPYYFTSTKLDKIIRNFVTIPFTYNEMKGCCEVDFKALEEALNENSKLLILINPSNPLTYVYSKEDYEKITVIIERFPNLIVAEDAAYFPYLLEGNKMVYFASIGNNYDRTITFFSGGKVFNVTGMRVGWMIGHPKHIQKLKQTHFYLGNLSSTFEQIVVAKNLKSSLEPYEGCNTYWDFLRKDSDFRFELLKNVMKDYKLNLIKPMGTYYCIADVRPYIGLIPEKYYYSLLNKEERFPENDKAFCRLLISRGIGFMPLSASQNCENKIDYFVRISINRDERDFKFLEDSFKELQNEYGFL